MIGDMLNNLMTKYKNTNGGPSASQIANLHSPLNFRSTNSMETNVEDVIHSTPHKVIYGGVQTTDLEMEEDRHIHKKRKRTYKEICMDEGSPTYQARKMLPSFNTELPSTPDGLRALVPDAEAVAIGNLGFLERQKAIAQCIPHLAKLMTLNCSMLMADKEFANAEEKMRDKLVKVEQENVALQAKVSSLESELADKMEELKVAKDLQTSLTKVEAEADTLWKKVADLRAESFGLVELIRKDNEENEVALDNKAKKEWATCVEVVKERDEATKDVDTVCVQSFMNAVVEQIKVLNPGVELKLDGLDCNKIVKDGHMVGE